MKKRRLILGMLILSVVFSATSASFSIAWYASATRLRVEMFEVNIDADRRLLISTEEEGEYVSALGVNDLRRTGYFTPVSTCFASTWKGEEEPVFYDMSFHFWDRDGAPYLRPMTKPEISPRPAYFSQTLYLKSDLDAYLGVDMEQSHILPNVEKNETYAETLAERAGDPALKDDFLEKLNNIHNCARMSVLVDGQYAILDPNGNEKGPVYYGGPLDNDNDNYFDAYKSDVDHEFYEVFYGEIKEGCSRDDLVYKPVSSTDVEADGEYSAFTARHQAGVHALDMEASKPFIATEPRLLTEDLAPSRSLPPFYFEADAYTPKKVVVSFYLEGWDLDSINHVMGASFDIDLSFKIIRER